MQNVIHPGFLLLLLGLALLRGRRERLFVALGTAASGLGLAAGSAGPVQALSVGFAAVEGALLAAGAVLAVSAAATAIRSVRTPAILAGSAAAAAGGVTVALESAPYLAAAPVGPLLLALGAMASLGGVLVLLGHAARVRRLGEPPSHHHRSAARDGSAGIAAIGFGALLAAAAPSAGLVFLGSVAAAAGGWLVRRREGLRPLPLAPLLTLLLLPAWWLMRTIAGPEGLSIGSLPDLPWSPAAERLLALVLLLAAWAASGLWPLHTEEMPALTAPVAALLVARVVLPAFPAGVEHWQPLFVPVVVAGLWHAVLTGRRASALAALAWIGLAAAQPVGVLGAGLILVAGLVVELTERMGKGSHALHAAAAGAATLAAGQGALLVVEAGLRAQVVYTVLAAAALVVAAARQPADQASTASEPSATSPSV